MLEKEKKEFVIFINICKYKFISIIQEKIYFQLAEDEEQLNQLLAVQDLLEEGETDEFDQALKTYSLANEADLIKMINNLQAKVERTRQKIVAANSQEENIAMEEQKPKIKSSLQPKDQQDFDEWIASVRKKRYEVN